LTTRVVTVEIAGQRYPIRSALDERYVAELAAYVDRKMRAASDAAPTSDTLGLAVLVALNIADECFRARAQQSEAHGELNERAMRLEQFVDEVLAQVADKQAG
jgi:cell division protein ZapA